MRCLRCYISGFWRTDSVAMRWSALCSQLIIVVTFYLLLTLTAESVLLMMPQFGKQSSDAKKRYQHQKYLVCIWFFKTSLATCLLYTFRIFLFEKQVTHIQGIWSDVEKVIWWVSRHFGPRTLRTQDISALSDWCRSVRTVRHQCQSVFWILRHWCRTVSTSITHAKMPTLGLMLSLH